MRLTTSFYGIETTGNANLAYVQYIGGQDTALIELVTTLLYFGM